MKILTTAIMTKFTAEPHNALYTALSGRMYKGIAQQTVTFPYGIYWLIVGNHSWTFNTKFENMTFNFSLFSKNNSSSEIEDLFINLKALYDDSTLVVSGSEFVYCRRESYRALPRDMDGVWAYHVTYRILTEQIT